MNRRSFLAGTAAAATAAILSGAPVVEPAPIVTPPVAPPAATGGTWGWGFLRPGDELIHGPYATREAAIEAGKEYFGERFDTVACNRCRVYHGDYHEALVNDLCEPGTDIAWSLQRAMESSNCDNDFEGEVEEAIAAVPWKAIAEAVGPAIWRAIARSGLFVDGDILELEFDGREALIEALSSDQAFQAELVAIIHPMVEATDVMTASNMLDTFDEVEHSFPVETGEAAA